MTSKLPSITFLSPVLLCLIIRQKPRDLGFISLLLISQCLLSVLLTTSDFSIGTEPGPQVLPSAASRTSG
jgi:hypothetical protein